MTVDPERDTPVRARQFVEAHDLSGRLVFLTGDRATLESVWAAYHIGVTRLPARGGATGAYEVVHNDVVYLVDKAGRERRLVRDFAVGDLLGSVGALAREQVRG